MKILSTNNIQSYKPNLRQVSFAQGSNKPKLYKDEATFSNDLIKTQYGIDACKIDVVADSKTIKSLNKNPELKIELVTRIIQAHEHAKKAISIDNFSGRKFATNMMLKDGTWALGVSNGSNAENATCGERNAINRLFSKALEKMSFAQATQADVQKDFRVKYLAMSSSKSPIGVDDSASKPCGDCLVWLNENKFFDENTQIVSLEPKSKLDKSIVLKVKNLKSILPYKGEMTSLAKDKSIEDMELEMTLRAKRFIRKNKISSTWLSYTMIEAKQAYDKSEKAPMQLSGIKNASAVLMNNGKISSAYKQDWTRRWFSHPDLLAISKVYQSNKMKPNMKVNAVAYYGDKDVPYVSSLAKIAQEVGSCDTLVLTIKEDKIQVRTILDYMPDMYVSSIKPVIKS